MKVAMFPVGKGAAKCCRLKRAEGNQSFAEGDTHEYDESVHDVSRNPTGATFLRSIQVSLKTMMSPAHGRYLTFKPSVWSFASAGFDNTFRILNRSL